MFRFKMAAIKRDQNLKKKKKNTLPKEFFNEIWLKVGEHEWHWLFEIEFGKKLFCLKMAAKTSFVTLHNNANLC